VCAAGAQLAAFPIMRPARLAQLQAGIAAASVSLAAAACTGPTSSSASEGEGAITSNDGHVLDFRFDAEVVAEPGAVARVAIVTQLQYMQGILTTAERGNAQVGLVSLSNVEESADGARKRIRYRASLPVAWPKGGAAAPASYAIALPRDVTDLDAFNAKYDGKCGANEYGRDSFWHDFNLKASGCTVDDADVARATATVTRHAKETTKKYPEYGEIWKDDALEVVALYGIVSSNDASDSAYTSSARLLRNLERMLTSPETKEGQASATILKDRTLTGKTTVLGRERTVKVTAIVVHGIEGLGRDFDARFDPLSESADILFYGGHSGLGKNVAALSRKGKVAARKYQLAVLNGCQTFAYLGSTMNDRRVQANGAESDPHGTRYLDVFANALPSYAHTNTPVLETFVRAALGADRPKHYNDLLAEMDAEHLAVVFGEDDNTFTP
jgi:hypothetical protein